MKMRALYEDKQRRWKEFRDAERQCRIDKANQQETNRLNAIIAESRARREYTNSKFQHSLTVRSYHQAALVIQRAFRRTRHSRAMKARLAQRQAEKVRRRREKAAIAIQRWWRRHQLQTLYKALHFRSIMTGPVVAVGKREGSPPQLHSYEREIAITGTTSYLNTPSGLACVPLARGMASSLGGGGGALYCKT